MTDRSLWNAGILFQTLYTPVFHCLLYQEYQIASNTLPTPRSRYLNLSQGQQQLPGMRFVKYLYCNSFIKYFSLHTCTTYRRIAPTELAFKPFGPPADHYMQQIGQLANRSSKALLPITLRSIRVCFVIRRFSQRPIMLNCNVPFLSGFQPPTPQAYLLSTTTSAEENYIQFDIQSDIL
jgi:hypothetical protein